MAVILTATTMGASVGPFDIYHTSEVGGNLLASGVSRSQLVSGYSVTPYDTYIIRSTGTCTNSVTVTGCYTATPTPTATSVVPTPTPTATPVGPTATPTVTPTPTSSRTALTVRYRTTGAPNADACLPTSPTNTYYFDGTQLQTATYVWTDPYINNPVPGGYTLSDGVTYRIVNAGGGLGANQPCSSSPPNTPTPTVPTQRMEIRECGQFQTYYVEFAQTSNFFNGGVLKLQSSGAFLDGKCWEIIDNNYTGGIVDYQAVYVSFYLSCGGCP